MTRRRQDSHSTLDVARLLGVTVQTVQRWVDAGHLQAWRTVGGHRRIDAASLQRFREASGELALSDGLALPPVKLPVNEDNPALPVAISEGDGSAAPRVLLVDDDPADRELLGYLFSRLRPSWQVEFAENGFAALLAIGRQRPDLLVTDVVMPYLNGPAMLRSLLAQPEHADLAVLAVSSHSEQEIQQLGGLPGGVSFLPKPLDRVALGDFLDRRVIARPSHKDSPS